MNYHWQRKREPVSHADDWLMTYADVITLLLCFFAIILSVSMTKKDVPHSVQNSQSVQQQVQQAVQPSVPQPIQPPSIQRGEKQADIFAGKYSYPGLERVETPSEKPADETPPKTAAEPENQAKPLNRTAPERAEDNGAVPAANAGDAKPSQSLPEIVDHLKSQGAANLEQKGDRITTIEVNSAAFFGSGSAILSDAGKSVLHDVAVNIKSDQFKDYQVTVEGHTDDTPIKTPQFPSNWELSTARASAVVHYFIDQAIPAQRLRAAGYADTFPKVPNRDAVGKFIPENRAQNRRVVIKLEKIDKTE